MGTNKVENVCRQVELIKAMGGDFDRIDTKEEFDKLSELLSKNVDKMTNEEKSYVRGLMIEYLNGEQPSKEPEVCPGDNTVAHTNDSQPTKCDESNPTRNKFLKYVEAAAIAAAAPVIALALPAAQLARLATNNANNPENTKQ